MAEAVDYSNVSWLGRWEDNGWSIKIGRKLTDEEWRLFGQHAEETWDNELMSYSPQLSISLLARLFPDVRHVLKYPPCNKRIKTDHSSRGGLPVHVLCESSGVVATHLQSAAGKRVCVVRCEAHAGQL